MLLTHLVFTALARKVGLFAVARRVDDLTSGRRGFGEGVAGISVVAFCQLTSVSPIARLVKMALTSPSSSLVR